MAKGKKAVKLKYSSLDELIHAATVTWEKGNWSKDSRTEGSSFYGTKSMDETLKFAREGWPEGTKKVHDAALTVNNEGKSLANETYDVAGYYPDPSRYAAGMPDHMVSLGSDHGKKKLIHIALNMGASSSITTEQITNYGAALLSVVDALECQGYSVKVTALSRSVKNNNVLEIATEIKQPDEYMDFERMAFCLANPSYLRRLIFAIFELPNHMFLGRGYGKPSNFKKYEDAIVLGGVNDNREVAKTAKSAFEFMVKQINTTAQRELIHIAQEGE